MARRVEWTDVAEWYDEKQGDSGDLWHRTLIDPPLIDLIGRVDGLRLLDIGCGNGYLARRFAREGAHVTGVDASKGIIARARARESDAPLGIVYHVADAAHLGMLDAGAFDLVYSNMAIMDIADAAGAIREVARLLRVGGRFVVSLNHPCFDTGSGSSWLIEQAGTSSTVSRRVCRYREPFDDWIGWRGPEGGIAFETQGFHRPLSWYVRTLSAVGLLFERFEEPRPTAEFLAGSVQGTWIERIPLHCILGAVKASAGPPPPDR